MRNLIGGKSENDRRDGHLYFSSILSKNTKVGEGTISTGLFSNGHQLAPPSAIGRHLLTSPALICIRFISMLMNF
jgi:hypothetical protein